MTETLARAEKPTALSHPEISSAEATAPTGTPNSPDETPSAPALPRVSSLAKSSTLHATKWALVIASIYILSELGSFAGLPATQMLFAAIFGLAIALSGRVSLTIPKPVQLSTQALIGVVMGGYMEFGQLKTLGPLVGPILLITAATLLISFAAGWALFRLVPDISLCTAVLGTAAGGSAAVVSLAEDLRADCRVVAFMQYFRLVLIVATTPLLVAWVFGAVPKGDSHRMRLNASFLNHYRCPSDGQRLCLITGRGDWLAGLCIAIVLCVIGIKLGQLLRFPSPATLGPMIVTAVVTSLGLSHGYVPEGILKELLFILIGLDVGLRFTRKALRQVWQIFPAILVTTVALSIVTAVIPAIAAVLLHVPQTDMYLATTPGGINAVIATASSVQSNMPLVASTQSLRLIMLVLALPLLARHLAKTVPVSPKT